MAIYFRFISSYHWFEQFCCPYWQWNPIDLYLLTYHNLECKQTTLWWHYQLSVVLFCNSTQHNQVELNLNVKAKECLTHLPWLPHINFSELIRIGSGNDSLPVQCQAITQTNVNLLSFSPSGMNFSEISIAILIFSLKNTYENVICELAIILRKGYYKYSVLS